MQPYGALAANGHGSLEAIVLVGGSSPALLPTQVFVNNVQCSLTNATS
jgi:hypothetical protein